MLIGRMQQQANQKVENKILVKEINEQVKIAVADGKPEATSHDHIGVQYIVNFHGLIKEIFNSRWQTIDEDSFDQAQDHYSSEFKKMIEMTTSQLQAIKEQLEK